MTVPILDCIARAKRYAECTRASAKQALLGKTFESARPRWLPVLGGSYVCLDKDREDGYDTRAEAVEAARKFRQKCRDWIENLSPEEQAEADAAQRARDNCDFVCKRVGGHDTEDAAFWGFVAAKIAEYDAALADNGRCRANRDGECSWSGCPQLRDGEPHKSGRHCPRDIGREGEDD